VTLYNVNTLLHALKQITMSMREVDKKMIRKVFGICVFFMFLVFVFSWLDTIQLSRVQYHCIQEQGCTQGRT